MYIFLVDTGVEISIIPLKTGSQHIPTSYKLQAANGLNGFNTYGEKTITLNIGLCCPFSWTFTSASVKIQILGTDFLTYFNLSVTMASCPLIENLTKCQIQVNQSIYISTGICPIIPESETFWNLLKKILRDYNTIQVYGQNETFS